MSSNASLNKNFLKTVEDDTRAQGFAFLDAASMKQILEIQGLKNWDSFADSWNDLGPDLYMADGGRYRRRRYATFALAPNHITRKRHQPHYQSRDYNALNGGIERWFEPVLTEICEHPAMTAILRIAAQFAQDMTPLAERPETWHAEVHQFRIEAAAGASGRPTPEGLHRDGVDWVMVLMVRRENIASGETSIHDLQHNIIGQFTLQNPMDTAFVDDHRVFHGVTAVHPVNTEELAFRDVLVVTLRHQ
ncbi:MAG: 2OG-Fe dioxygenase family protein [Acetobacter sp.]|nr:2OG-Fe dioxygenase family protein [Acetobacter sp.]